MAIVTCLLIVSQFSRRWVVQEIALAREAVVYCGQHSIAWHEFAIAVELFVEVETATHRLSEIIRKELKDQHVPGLFEHVSALGASLLVDATDRLFRDFKQEHNTSRAVLEKKRKLNHSSESETGSDTDSTEESESDENFVAHTPPESGAHSKTWKPRVVPPITTKNNMRPLLSLEYLVSSLTIFETSVPHDTIYALLAIAKDTTPKAARGWADLPGSSDYVREGLEVFTQRKRYNVNYELPYVDVCKEFIEFAIERSLHVDPSRALDVICRPWATEQKILDAKRFQNEQKDKKRERAEMRREDRKQRRIPSKAAQMLSVSTAPNQGQNTDAETSKNASQKNDEKEERRRQDMKLPSWVPQLSAAPFGMYQQAGLSGPRMSRKNADTLVGLPSTTRKVYSAAETKKVDMKVLKFRKRADILDSVGKGHFSMYIRGFQVDTIEKVEQVSQNGQIPREWTELANWQNTQKKAPPEAFGRTLVADRGRDGKNPPVYYSRACAESFKKGGYESGAVNTSDLINYERNSVVSQFCRRVQAVVWNRALVLTKKERLGLVTKDVKRGDLVCILYGLSVPVILRKSQKKSPDDIEKELEWELQYIQKKIRGCFKQYKARKAEHERRKDRDMLPLVKEWLNDPDRKPIPRNETQCESLPETCITWSDYGRELRKASRPALRAFREWRAQRRKAEWLELTREGLVGDAGDDEQAPGALDSRSKPKNTTSGGGRALSGSDMLHANPNRGREKGKSPAIPRSTNVSKERKPIDSHKEINKSPMDWWGFEYALKAGRRWRRIIALRKKKMEEDWKIKAEEEWKSKLEQRKEQWKIIQKQKLQAQRTEAPTRSNLSGFKQPIRSKTHSESGKRQSEREVENLVSRGWNPYSTQEPHISLQTPKHAQNNRSGIGLPLHEHNDHIFETLKAKSGLNNIASIIQMQTDNKAQDISEIPSRHHGAILGTVHEEPSNYAAEGSTPDPAEPLPMQQTDGNTAGVETPSDNDDAAGEDNIPYPETLSHNDMLGSVATLIDVQGGTSHIIPGSSEQMNVIPAEIASNTAPINDALDDRTNLSQQSTPTVPHPKVLQTPSLPEAVRTSGVRASWHLPKMVFERLRDEEKPVREREMKEWLRNQLFKDGDYWYELLGECYIHGIMDGEAMLYQNEGDEDEEDEYGVPRHVPSVVYEIR